jgi:hypothetical protein
MLATVIDALAAWLGRLLNGGAPELVPVPIPVEQPRRRRR